MALLPKNRRRLLVALVAVVVAAATGVAALAMGGEDNPTAGTAARPSVATAAPTTAQPLTDTTGTTTPEPSTSDTPTGDRPDDGGQAGDGEGRRVAGSDQRARGGHRGGRPSPGARGDGPPCRDRANVADPVAPVSGDSPAMQIRQQSDVALVRLRETTPPPQLEQAWQGLLLYFRRTFQLAARAGAGPLAPADRVEVDRLTRDLYGKFGDEVSAHLRRRC